MTVTVWTLPARLRYATIDGADRVEHHADRISIYLATTLLASFGPGYAWAIETNPHPDTKGSP